MNKFKTPVILDTETKQHRPIEGDEKIDVTVIPISALPGNHLRIVNGELHAAACGEEEPESGGD